MFIVKIFIKYNFNFSYTTENRTCIEQLEDIKQIINASKLLLCYGIRYPLKMLIDNLTNIVFFRKVMVSICEYTSM